MLVNQQWAGPKSVCLSIGLGSEMTGMNETNRKGGGRGEHPCVCQGSKGIQPVCFSPIEDKGEGGWGGAGGRGGGSGPRASEL